VSKLVNQDLVKAAPTGRDPTDTFVIDFFQSARCSQVPDGFEGLSGLGGHYLRDPNFYPQNCTTDSFLKQMSASRAKLRRLSGELKIALLPCIQIHTPYDICSTTGQDRQENCSKGVQVLFPGACVDPSDWLPRLPYSIDNCDLPIPM